MPIRGRTPGECFEKFRAHVAELVSTVLGPMHHVTMRKAPGETSVRDMQLGPTGTPYVRLKTNGPEPVYFALAQDLGVELRPDGDYQLKTRQYWYQIFDVQPDLDAEPLFRWEYMSEVPDGKQWCRHHFQVGRVVNDGGKQRGRGRAATRGITPRPL